MHTTSRTCIILIGVHVIVISCMLRNLIFYAETLGNAYWDTTFDKSRQRPTKHLIESTWQGISRNSPKWCGIAWMSGKTQRRVLWPLVTIWYKDGLKKWNTVGHAPIICMQWEGMHKIRGSMLSRPRPTGVRPRSCLKFADPKFLNATEALLSELARPSRTPIDLIRLIDPL
jgi:hypothetical protein